MSIRLYIGNLPKELDKKELQAVFAQEGDSVSAKVITDRKTGKCRGFGFVTVPTDEKADEIIEKFNGYMFKENALKIEKALPRSKGKEKSEEEQSQPRPQPAAPIPSGGNSSSGSGSGSGGSGGGAKSGGGNRRRDNKRRGGGSSGSSSSQATSSDSVQPDPRWASALEELRQRLAAQTTNS